MSEVVDASPKEQKSMSASELGEELHDKRIKKKNQYNAPKKQ